MGKVDLVMGEVIGFVHIYQMLFHVVGFDMEIDVFDMCVKFFFFLFKF